MSKDSTFYFSHDYNVRSDIKIRNLILKHGALGYGVFWMLIEDLYNNTNVLPLNYDLISFDLRVDKNVLQSVINDFDLFVVDNDSFGSLSVQRRLDERNEKSRKAKESIAKRWEKTKKDTNVLQPYESRNTIKERKGKESKGKEIKESTTVVVDIADSDFSKISNSEIQLKTNEPKKERKVAPKERNEDFALTMKQSQQWKDQVCMIYKIRSTELDTMLDEFVMFLSIQQKEHSSKKDFVEHFNNWSRKNISKRVSNQPTLQPTFSINR